MDGITLGGLESQLCLQLVLPLHLLLVVEVGLEGHHGQGCIVVVTSLVPVIGKIGLRELERCFSLEGPEVGTARDSCNVVHHVMLNVRQLGLLRQFVLRLDRSRDVSGQGSLLHELFLRLAEVFGMQGIHLGQHLVDPIKGSEACILRQGTGLTLLAGRGLVQVERLLQGTVVEGTHGEEREIIGVDTPGTILPRTLCPRLLVAVQKHLEGV